MTIGDAASNAAIKVTVVYEGEPNAIEQAIHGPSREAEILFERLTQADAALEEAEAEIKALTEQVADLTDEALELRVAEQRISDLNGDVRYERNRAQQFANERDAAEVRLNAAEAEIETLQRLPEFREDGDCLNPSYPKNLVSMKGFKSLIRILVRDCGGKIAAIKMVREATGLGLKEAKDLVEWTEAEIRPFGSS